MVKEGYKQTDIGMLPEDWEVKEIGELGEIVRGGSPRPAGDSRFFNGSFIPWLTVASLTNLPKSEMYVKSTSNMLTEEGSKRSRTLELDTVIISNSGATLGVAKILNIQCCANDGIAAIINQKLADKPFLVQYFNTLTKYLHDMIATGNGQPNLNTTLIKNIKIPFPPEKEQKAISKTLSDTDELINSLEKLIAKKAAIKQGAMQQLLTGKKRLSGFSRKWEEKRLGDIVDFFKGNGLSKTKLNENGSYYCILYGELFTTYNRKIDIIVSKTNSKEGILSKKNDILMPASTTTQGIDLAIASTLHVNNILLGGDINILRPKVENLNSDFLANYLTVIKKNQIAERTQGITIIHLYGKDLIDLDIEIPTLEEQKAIAQIISDMDNEIESFKQKLSKTKAIKEAMMSELLTGKTRLKVTDS